MTIPDEGHCLECGRESWSSLADARREGAEKMREAAIEMVRGAGGDDWTADEIVDSLGALITSKVLAEPGGAR